VAIVEERHFRPLADEADPDDYRPDSELAIVIRYLERNPAPGTEGDEPGPPLAFDVRELLEGDPGEAIRPLSEEDFQTIGR
jgi:hypothetical protein